MGVNAMKCLNVLSGLHGRVRIIHDNHTLAVPAGKTRKVQYSPTSALA